MNSPVSDLFSPNVPQHLTITFDPNILGSLPTRVGIVLTDVGQSSGANVTLEVWSGPGRTGARLGGVTAFRGNDGTFQRNFGDDSFFGIGDVGPIGSLHLTSNAGFGGLEADVLYYGSLSRRVYVVPGILGSSLSMCTPAGPDVKWLDFFAPSLDGDLRDLELPGPPLGCNCATCIAATHVFDCSPQDHLPDNPCSPGVWGDFYGDLIGSLRQSGYDPIPFPYDWRLDIVDTARALHDRIAADNISHYRGDPVDIVSHSLGTLVTRRLLVGLASGDYGSTSVQVGNAVYLAPPFGGTGLAVQPVITGQIDASGGLSELDLFVDPRADDDQVIASARTWPSVYETLPKTGFFAANAAGLEACRNLVPSYPGLVWSRNLMDENQPVQGFDQTRLGQYGGFLSSLEGSAGLSREVVIAGLEHPTQRCALAFDYRQGLPTHFRIEPECGDGTMTLQTIAALGQADTKLYLLNTECPAGTEPLGSTLKGTMHQSIPGNPVVHAAIRKWLDGFDDIEQSAVIAGGCKRSGLLVDGAYVIRGWDGVASVCRADRVMVWTASPLSLRFVDPEGMVTSESRRDRTGATWLGFPENEVLLRPGKIEGRTFVHPTGESGGMGHVFEDRESDAGRSILSAELMLDGNAAPWEFSTSVDDNPELHRDLDGNGSVDQIVPLEPDRDADGVPDGRDNCPLTADTSQSDGDGDGAGDLCDCAPSDAAAFSLPAEVSNLRFLSDRQTLLWDPATPGAGQGTVHDVVRGSLSGLPVGAGVSETCLAFGLTQSTMTDGNAPPLHEGFWYLVRGRNICGAGRYGSTDTGTETSSSACP
jgi:hypothetical protein